MELSIDTGYLADVGPVYGYLRKIREAGFSYVMWGHHWGDDFFYHRSEIEQIRIWLGELGLKVHVVHASSGVEKEWGSVEEYRRQAGVELIRNRIDFAGELSCRTICIHHHSKIDPDRHHEQVLRSLGELEPDARRRGVRIAIENYSEDDFVFIRHALNTFAPDYVGLCYDCGHGQNELHGLDHLKTLTDRLICAHIHDTTRRPDQPDYIDHILPFTGAVDWNRLARLLAKSTSEPIVNLEIIMPRCKDLAKDEVAFLKACRKAGQKFSEMIQA